MDRVLLGKAEANDSPYYTRSDEFGLFVSKPGANVLNCSDGDLIFDSTSRALMQPVGRGFAVIPKAEYYKGFFGEEGLITDDNWNTTSLEPAEINEDTSWAFAAMKQIQKEVDEIRDNTQIDMYSQDGNNPVLNQRFEVEFQIFQNFKWLNNEYKQFDPFRRTIKNFLVDGDLSIRKMIKDMWRIFDIFPFLNIDNHFFGQDLNPSSGYDPSTFLKTIVESPEIIEHALFAPSAGGPRVMVYDYELTGDGNYRPLVYKVITPDTVKPLSYSTLKYDLLGGQTDFSTNANFPYFYSSWKTLWTSANINASNYSKTAYSSSELLAGSNPPKPVPWRAWTTPAGGQYTQEEELHAIVKFYTYMVLFGWMYHSFGKQVHDGFLDYAISDSTDTSINVYYNYFDLRSPTNSGFPAELLYDFKISTTCPSAYTSFSQHGTNLKFDYSKWTGGSIEVNTGVKSPNDLPIQIWWNSILKSTSNSVTNLSVLNDTRNRIKTGDPLKRAYVTVPGISSIHANTYVLDSTVYVRFSQPSTSDDTNIFYTAYKESAWIRNSVGAISPTYSGDLDNLFKSINAGGAALTYDHRLDFDVRDQSDGGDNLAGRKSTDGRYYTIVFPDDFIGTRSSSTDPFANYRDESGRINQSLLVVLTIPEGVVVSGNAFFNHITTDELRVGTSYSGDVPYGPADSAGRRTTEIYAANDPCIKLNLHSNEFTDDALSGLTIRIENSGMLIGAGGWGSYGQISNFSGKYQRNYPGGGGGGGAGYHPALQTESQADWLGTFTPLDYPNYGIIDTPEEIANVAASASTHWKGPNNYIEWGIGGNANIDDANTYYTGMDYITWKSIGPGKAGTGYLGSTPSYVFTHPSATLPRFGFPYGPEFLEPDESGRLNDETRLYERLAGTYNYGGVKRYNAEGWGKNGTPGTETQPGVGGAESIVQTFGYNQHPYYKIEYNNPSDDIGNVNIGFPSAGSGGSCVYLYSNTESQIIGTSVLLINRPTGIIKSGGGGGSGAVGTGGLGGGKLGRPGKYSPDVYLSPGDPANTSELSWNQYSRRGEPGRLVWWNTTNVASSYSIENNSTSSNGAIEGLDYNSAIDGEDYVSYAPNITVNIQFGSVETTIQAKDITYWSRTLDDNGNMVYTGVLESNYVDYVNSPNSPESFNQ